MMGVDAKAYIDVSYEPRELLRLFEAMGQPMKWIPDPRIANGFGTFSNENHSFNLHPASCEQLHHICLMGRTARNADLLHDVVKRLGGLFMRADSEGTIEEEPGMLSLSNGIPYFYRWGVLEGIITDCSSVEQLQAAIDEWHKQINGGR